ncbi:MAG: protein-L-isoaspartate(D-aspartate) O-methyltransferase [Planctomycetota bacterium]|nr:protein-L-isoaspartate(D-aspartate) O-methyltransferase [Planctomycetota bacterium]
MQSLKIVAWIMGAAIMAAALGLTAGSCRGGQEPGQPPPTQAEQAEKDDKAATGESDEAQAESDEAEEDEKPAGDAEPFEPPSPPAARERIEERETLVDRHIARAHIGSPAVKDEKVLAAMRTVPRHVFVPAARRRHAYADTPLPIGYGQTISQPYIVALMTSLLELTPDEKVLEIGTGSGYQAAVLAQLTPHVYTIEIIEALAERAEKALRGQGYTNINCRRADGYHGWKEEAPFDAIIVTCAAGHLPPPLWEQLKPGGRMVIPIGGQYELQRLVLMTKQEDGSRRSESILAVRFVPLTRERER